MEVRDLRDAHLSQVPVWGAFVQAIGEHRQVAGHQGLLGPTLASLHHSDGMGEAPGHLRGAFGVGRGWG